MSIDIKPLLPYLREDDGSSLFLTGDAAELESLRSKKDTIFKISNTAGEVATEEETSEDLIYHLGSSSVSLSLPSLSFSKKLGQIFITTKRIFFVSAENEDKASDFSMNAYCISLHALMSDPSHSIYCQICDEVGGGTMDDNDDASVMSRELIIEPLADDDTIAQDACQSLFKALSKLISLNPIDDDEEDGFGSGGGGSLAAMLGLMTGGPMVDDEDDDDMICRIDPSQMITAANFDNLDANGPGASAEERRKMLERLDNVLVVPPELEGQFDDADEELDSTDKDIL